MISDMNIEVVIGELLPGDKIATINNQNSASNNPFNVKLNKQNDLGIFFDLLDGEINHSIINLDIESKVTLTINSNVENAILEDVAFSITDVDLSGSLIPTNKDFLEVLQQFTKTLIGRPIQIFKYLPSTNIAECIFDGYISGDPGAIRVQSGTQIVLICNTVLSQLSQISSNSSWQDATQKYGNIFTGITGNTVNYQQLLTSLREGSLSEDSTVIQTDGAARPMPENVWAVIIPNKARLNVIREILIPYSRVIFQQENGDISIQPLFIDDPVEDIFNVNCFNNYYHVWTSFASRNNSSHLPNRIDVQFGVNLPYDQFGSPNVADNSSYASTPKINTTTNLVESFQVENAVDYSTVYSSSTRLYNSGKFSMPLMITLSIDNSLLLDDNLLNGIMSLYNSKDFVYSNVYVSGSQKQNSIALLYSQIFMAQSNVNNYNATITYDYTKVADAASPLGKIISIWNASNIDYHDMIVIGTSLTFSPESGTLYTIDTAPLLSITGVWSTV